MTNLLDLPHNHYGAILADPPWRFEVWSGETAVKRRSVTDGSTNVSAATHYQTMTMRDIARLPVGDLAADNCVLFMWVVWPSITDALRIINDWGFTYKTCAFSWMKGDPYRLFADEATPSMGLGYWTRANTEPCLLATRGKPKRLDAGVRQGIIAPRRQHSRKPDEAHERIERLVAGPYLELFARQRRPGWDCWGNETDKFNPRDDFSKSTEECYRAIKERVANGGPERNPP